ncbi:hypothetical protein QEZ52_07955 [Aliisedimentitalea scapharcae]|uniref:HdeA/HdeB family protein n=1 Tax=Aliisedimentitalea scapharcae TaxID=1524259 RepID=A0ABZ2XWJ4_9RHOB|nr:hypothetical protein [Sulfitobacter sp. SK012]AXI46373.1 hypothetical protein C1J03_10245 [Sulfitobacter sp. SK012]
MKYRLVSGLTVGALLAATATSAQVSDASKLGANAGAMEYCRDNFMTDDDNGRYGLLVAATTKDFSNLSADGDKTKALLMKKAAEDGDYLGKPLDAGRCESVRKTLLTQYGIK